MTSRYSAIRYREIIHSLDVGESVKSSSPKRAREQGFYTSPPRFPSVHSNLIKEVCEFDQLSN